MWLTWLVVIIGGYLLGSVPCAYLFVKMKNGMDIRKYGSGNPGSTNSLRAAGPLTAALVFLCDGLKSAIPTWLGLTLVGPGLAACAGLAAFLGHLYPLWLGFEGGKGVACTLGMGLVLVPWIALISLGVWAVLTVVLGYVSIASCAAVTAAFVMCLLSGQPWMVTLLFGLAAGLVILRHRSNFQHIKDGTEHKFLRRH